MPQKASRINVKACRFFDIKKTNPRKNKNSKKYHTVLYYCVDPEPGQQHNKLQLKLVVETTLPLRPLRVS